MNFETAIRTIEITVETSESLTLRRSGKVLVEYCDRCGFRTRMVTPVELSLIIGVSTTQIFADIELGAIHHKGSPDGSKLICLRSATECESVEGVMEKL